VEVRSVALLELHNPEIFHAGNEAAQGHKKGVEVALAFAAVRRPFIVVSKAQLGDESRKGVHGTEAEFTSGVFRKAGYL
jgi:hypothetical protein